MDVGDSTDWPPPGWTEDVKISNGRKIKYYTNGETGKKFYSKKEVTRYLNRKDTCDDVTQTMNYHGKSCSENNSSRMNNQGESISKDNVSQVDNQDKNCSENNASQTVGGPDNSHEWLPPGWIVELKTRKSGSHAGATYKVFVDPSTGNKFYSKPEVSKYLKTMKQNNIVGGGQIHGNGEVSSSNQKRSEDSKNIRGRGQSRISKRQKSDTDQASPGIEGGSLFKLKASQDFEEVGEQSCIAKRKKSGINRTTKTSPSHGAGEDFILNEKTSLDSKENGAQSPQSKRQKPGSDCPSAKSVSSIAVDCDSADELPPGWKKEVISRQTDRGTRKDPIYTDPVHGYKFRSKKEVFRYLQTGDARRCATRPAKKNVASTSEDDSPTTDDASLKKLGCFLPGRKLFAADESKGGKSLGTFSPSQQFESSKKQPDCSVSDPNAIITSILAEINENHSFETVEDAEIETLTVGVEQPSSVATESDLPEKELLENKQEKNSYKAVMQQSRKSRNTESLNFGRRVSKRLAGQNPEAAVDLDIGERALPAVVDKSASPSLSVNVCSQELLQDSDPTPETGKSDQASLNGEASLDELPPGWKKEIKITKKAHGIRKDPLYIDPVHGYVFRSKKDVFRYLQTGDISSCAIRPVKRDLDATTKETSFYTDPVHGYVFRSKKDVMRYLQTGDIRSCAVKPTKRDLDSTMKDNSTSTHDTSSKKLRCSLAGRQLSATEESKGGKCSVTCSLALHAESSNEHPESSILNLNTSISSIEAVSPQFDYLPEQQLPENEKEKHNNKGGPKGMKQFRNSKSSTPVRRVSKRLSRHNPEMVTDLDLGERAHQVVVNNSASSGLPMNVSGGELAQKTDLATGDSDQPSLSGKASSRDDPFKVVRCLSEGQAFKEQNDERILQDSQPAGISHERGKVHLEHHAVKQRPTGKLAKEEQDGQNRLLDNSQSAEPSWRNVDLNVENQQWQDVQLAPSQRSVDLNMDNQQWQDSQLAPSQRSVDLNVENQQWQDPQLAEPSRRDLDLNVENQPVKEKQTGELVTENQDEQNRRLHAQLASYPFGDYWSDPCLEFAFKTLTGAIPVEDTLSYQGSTYQEYNPPYPQADDGCFELPLFNTSSYYMNDVPNHCAPSEEQPPINQTFLPPGNNSTPCHSSVVSQNPGLTFLPNGNNSTPGWSNVGPQNPGLGSQAKDYQSKFKSQR